MGERVGSGGDGSLGPGGGVSGGGTRIGPGLGSGVLGLGSRGSGGASGFGFGVGVGLGVGVGTGEGGSAGEAGLPSKMSAGAKSGCSISALVRRLGFMGLDSIAKSTRHPRHQEHDPRSPGVGNRALPSASSRLLP